MSGGGQVVGVVGLGAMGRGVAGNLLRKGFGVIGWDVSPTALRWLRDNGGAVAGSAQELAHGCDIVVSFVVDDMQTEDVLFGGFGLAHELRKSSIVVACSTMPPSYVRALGERLGGLGLQLLDAPVTGGMVGAQKGTLTVMVGGPAAALDRARPVLSAFGTRIHHLGEANGAGAQMKVINQLLCGVHIVAAAEGLALAHKHGLPLGTALEILQSGSAPSWMLGDRGPRMARGAFDEVTSAINIFVKDMGLVIDAARESSFAAPLAHAAFLSFLAASGKGWGKLDDSAVMRNYDDAAADAPGRAPAPNHG
ncbi:MAG: NAD(P)-dependent oxidoreductase [Ramlibacter sp.]